jgi:hypothetical protein
VSFFFDVPRVAQTHILGIPVTGKTLTYLLGLQVCSTSIATVISGLCGIVSILVKVQPPFQQVLGVQCLGCEADHTSPCITEFKNAWNFAFTAICAIVWPVGIKDNFAFIFLKDKLLLSLNIKPLKACEVHGGETPYIINFET